MKPGVFKGVFKSWDNWRVCSKNKAFSLAGLLKIASSPFHLSKLITCCFIDWFVDFQESFAHFAVDDSGNGLVSRKEVLKWKWKWNLWITLSGLLHANRIIKTGRFRKCLPWSFQAPKGTYVPIYAGRNGRTNTFFRQGCSLLSL